MRSVPEETMNGDHGSAQRGGDEATLWRAVGRGFGRLFRAADGFSSWETPTTALASSGVCRADFNCGVIDAGATVAADVATMAGHLRQRRLPGLLLVADRAGREARVPAEAAALVLAGRMPLMTRKAGIVAPVPSGFQVRRAVNAADLVAATEVMAAAFDLPRSHVQAAFPPGILAANDVCVDLVLDGEEAVGALQSTIADGMAGIWSMATLPGHRRRGVARAGLIHALTHRFSDGCHTAFLIATDAGRPLYDALGFEVAAWCDVWLVEDDRPSV